MMAVSSFLAEKVRELSFAGYYIKIHCSLSPMNLQHRSTPKMNMSFTSRYDRAMSHVRTSKSGKASRQLCIGPRSRQHSRSFSVSNAIYRLEDSMFPCPRTWPTVETGTPETTIFVPAVLRNAWKDFPSPINSGRFHILAQGYIEEHRSSSSVKHGGAFCLLLPAVPRKRSASRSAIPLVRKKHTKFLSVRNSLGMLPLWFGASRRTKSRTFPEVMEDASSTPVCSKKYRNRRIIIISGLTVPGQSSFDSS